MLFHVCHGFFHASPSLSLLPLLYLSLGDVSSSKHTLHTDRDLICQACYKGDLEGMFD